MYKKYLKLVDMVLYKRYIKVKRKPNQQNEIQNSIRIQTSLTAEHSMLNSVCGHHEAIDKGWAQTHRV